MPDREAQDEGTGVYGTVIANETPSHNPLAALKYASVAPTRILTTINVSYRVLSSWSNVATTADQSRHLLKSDGKPPPAVHSERGYGVRKQRGNIDVESARHPFMACALDMSVNTINFMQNNAARRWRLDKLEALLPGYASGRKHGVFYHNAF